jgi:hypothetical protein
MKPKTSLLPLCLALLALALWMESFDGFGGRDQLHQYDALSLCALHGNEAIFYAGAAFVQVFFVAGLGVWLAGRWGASADRIAGSLFAGPRATLVGLGVAGGALSLLIAIVVVRQHTLTEDEKTYLFQARLLLMGKLSIAVPPEADAFRQSFLVIGDAGKWSGQYFWAQPALLALGLVAHAVYALPAIEVACVVYFTGLLVKELSSDARAAVLASVLTAISPIVVLTGATLNNATLSAACGAVSLWSLARLHRSPSRGATLGLALSTAIGLHNRVLDHAALLAAGACILAVAHRGGWMVMIRRLLPAVLIALPFLALHGVLNAAVSGDWRHSGYWLESHETGWTMMGFGRGAGNFPQDPSTASSKTIANAIRMAFYTAGGPLVFLPLAPLAAGAITGRPLGILRAGAWVTFVYFGAYLLYASASTPTTGPVYFDALVPVLAGCAAVATIWLHDAVRERLRRLVPALVLAQIVAAFAIFWPSALLEVGRAARDSAACDDVADGVEPGARALVFVAHPPPGPFRSLTNWPPMPSPLFDDRALFPRIGGPENDRAVVARFGAGRTTYLAHCISEATPRIERYDP